ncbi:hypothetical protein Cgig2_001769 [Carnegiea gigantea]|uniref:Uncharacterized protein n=1 Tax=Carnegiea gigantea TaxID=171969 RepID=A0A9Q1K9L1_9CARY|nr:hypothetical protein Cgig2_001769 [Carnegiea gigantea]
MELEFDKYCKIGWSPRTVLPPHSQMKGENRSRKEKPTSRNGECDLLPLEEEGFTNIKFRNYRSVSCKNLSSEAVELECNEVHRRGSVYQSSRERTSRRPAMSGGRKKIEFSLGNETAFSFGILDSICGSDEEAEAEALEKETPLVNPLNSDMVSSAGPPPKPCPLNLKDRRSDSGKSAERDLIENQKFKCDQVCSPSNDANVLKERDTSGLNKSLYAKLALPHSPTHSEGESSKGSPKPRFTPIRKMFDPLTKSKSYRNPSNDAKSAGLAGSDGNKTLKKSLLHEFSSAVTNVESAPESVKKDPQPVAPPCSPVHLNGNLKMERKHGVPYFEFSMTHSEDVFVAKTWKTEDAPNWVYTFHTIRGRKKNNVTGWGVKYNNKGSPMVGQMQVSCYLCSELRGHGAFSSSMVTEFVLYDIAHARNSITAEEEVSSAESSKVSGDSSEGLVEGNVQLDNFFGLVKPRVPTTNVTDHNTADVSTPYPWAPADLHPNWEIAAVVVQVPFEKRGSLKYKRGDKLGNQDHASLLDLPLGGLRTKSVHDDERTVKVNVVTPLGNHGLPCSDESRGPSPLLDRWRVGGGCDCGGWDMACPLIVFSNSTTQCMEEYSILQQNQPLNLYVQGRKENMPALAITIKEKGQYAVHFHAQLSALQAFAACVAILHTTEASGSAEQEKNEQLLQCSSLKVLVEDEVKVLVEAVTAEERRKVTKKAEENLASFVLNPPFSPFARV